MGQMRYIAITNLHYGYCVRKGLQIDDLYA